MLAAFLASRIGRYVIGFVVSAVALAVVAWRIYGAGAAAEQQKQVEKSLDNLRERANNDDKIHSLPDADRRARLSEWVQPE